MKLKLTFLPVLAALFFISSLQAQDNGKSMPKIPPTWAKVFGTNNYPYLPDENSMTYQNPNKTTRVYHTGIGDIVVPPNVIPFPAAATESEVTADLMIGNQTTMYAEWNSYGPAFYGTGFCFTNNGGTSWTGNYNNMNPSNNGGDPGPFIWPTGSTWAGRLGTSDLNGSYTACVGFYSTDNGITWTSPVTMGTTGSVDKNLSCVDDVPGSPFLGRAYTVWSNFSASQPPIVAAYSADGGASWTGYQQVSPAPDGSHYCQGCEVKVGPGGVVYVVWAYVNTGTLTENDLGFAKSTNGGVSWTSATNTAVPTNGIRGTGPNGIRVDGFPRLAVDRFGGATNGNIYVAMGEKNVAPATDASDMCLMKSTNGGATWTHTRINQDASGSGRWQFLGDICVDPNGGVNCSYYDQRNTSGNVCEFWLSRSVNAGASWTDVAVSDHQFTPAAISGLASGYQGDYTGIVASTSKVWPFWMDNSSGHYQVWTAGVSTGPPPAHDYAVGPFMGFPPAPLLINIPYTIKTQVVNAGSSSETNVPITFYINGTLTNTTNKSLNAGQVDSVSNVWTPTVAGTYTLKYISNLATDLNRGNDTIQTTVNVLTSLPALCEQFETATFPPTGWSGGGTYMIRRSGVSGFGIGTGCVEYNSWSAPTGDVEDLFTSTFPATGTHDSIVVDLAYASYPAGGITQDSLIITASTNGGTTYVSVARLGPLQLATAPAQSTEFTPTAGQWKKVAFVLPSGTNKIDFQGKSQFGNDIFFDSTCLKSGIVGISNNGNNIPRVYSLAQNYPNPFNPTTTISFGLPKAGLVKLVVYDILGRIVSTLVNEHRDAGMYNIAFDASNISSGVYFYKVESDDFSSIKKMVLVK